MFNKSDIFYLKYIKSCYNINGDFMKRISIITIIIILIDRLLKIIVNNTLKLFVKYDIIDNFFYLFNCHNEGAAFSILNGNVFFLIVITLVALFLIIKFIKKENNYSNINTISYGLLLGGIFGNLIDRIIYGYVIDYLGFIIFNYNFPIFNFADISIVIGAFLLIIKEFGGEVNESKSRS